MKKLTLIILSILMIVTLAACGNKCDHAYDNECDATCNECGEAREVDAHDWNAADCDTPKTCKTCGKTEGEPLSHEWNAADCITPKTCKVCKITDGKALGHTPEADDGDCATALNCGVCGEQIKAAGEHTPEKDEGNCTTEQKCTVCGQTAVAATTGHNDADHDYLCDNAGCQVTVGNPPEDTNPGIDLPIDTN